MTPKNAGENDDENPFNSFRDKIEASLGTPKNMAVENRQRNSSQSRKHALSLSIKIEEVPDHG